MHQLLLLRHAKSTRDEPGVGDIDRPLASRGRHDMAAVRTAMRELGLVPDLVLVSPARRTRETAALLEPWDDTPLIETPAGLYLAPAARMLELLRDVAETVRSVLMIGHNPGMHELAHELARRADERVASGFPTAALAEFAVAGPWSELSPANARLQRFLTPKILARDHG